VRHRRDPGISQPPSGRGGIIRKGTVDELELLYRDCPPSNCSPKYNFLFSRFFQSVYLRVLSMRRAFSLRPSSARTGTGSDPNSTFITPVYDRQFILHHLLASALSDPTIDRFYE
jgi:hypothetical protein